MRIFLRTFNDSINSKTGAALPEGQYRGTPEWIIFQNIIISYLKELGHDINIYIENPRGLQDIGSTGADKRIYVHQTKREKPEGDLFWMQMHMRELFTIDTNGWGADHSGNNLFNLEEVKDEATKFCEEKSSQLLKSGISKCPQPQETQTIPEGCILVPIQIPRDYTIKHHSPVTVRYFIESIQAWAIEHEVHVAFKMHPHNSGDYDLHKTVDDAAVSSEFVHKVEGNIHALIKRSRGVFVINSGTGFESLIHGKPVATFGDCDYKRVTFNADLRRLEEAHYFIQNYEDKWREIGYKFVWWYWMKHAYDVNREDTKERLTAYLKGVL